MSNGSGPLQRRPDRAALAIAAGLAVFGLILILDVMRLSEVNAGYSGVGPGAAPRVIGIGLILLGIWTAIDALKARFPERPKQDPVPILWIVGGLLAQLLLLKPLGFSIATGLMFAAVARAFGKRNLLLSVPIGIAVAFVVWVIFSQLLMLSLPAGAFERVFFPGAK